MNEILRKVINDILMTTDLTQISAKIVREQLETQLSGDDVWNNCKKEIDKIIMDFIVQFYENGELGPASEEDQPTKDEDFDINDEILNADDNTTGDMTAMELSSSDYEPSSDAVIEKKPKAKHKKRKRRFTKKLRKDRKKPTKKTTKKPTGEKALRYDPPWTRSVAAVCPYKRRRESSRF